MNNKIKEKLNIDSDSVIQPGIQDIDIPVLGVTVFKKDKNLLESELFGIKLKYVGIIALLIYYLKK